MAITYEPIATTTLATAASSITFSSIPSTYTDLRLVMNGTTSAADWSYLRFNGGTGSSTLYSVNKLAGSGTANQLHTITNYDKLQLGDALFGVGTSTTIPVFVTADIFSYANTSYYKGILTSISGDLNGSGYVYRNANLYRSASAISSMVISNASGSNFSIGFTATLYGIKAA